MICPSNYGEHFAAVYNKSMQLDNETVFQKTTWDHCFNKTIEPINTSTDELTFIGHVERFCNEVVADILDKLEVC